MMLEDLIRFLKEHSLVPDNHFPKKSIRSILDGEVSHCENDEKPSLFYIVANKRDGLDVVKFDHIARDTYMMGIPSTVPSWRIIQSARVIDGEICFNIKDVNLLLNIGASRFGLHKEQYNHKTAKAIEYMIVDALKLAEPFNRKELHGITDNGTTFPSPIDLSASFNRDLVTQVATVIGNEAEALGLSQVFAPVLDLSRELRWGRVEENYGEDPFLTGEIGSAYMSSLQTERRQNTSSTAIARVAATCKQFPAFGSPQVDYRVAFGDHVFFNASNKGITPHGVHQFLVSSEGAAFSHVKANFAQGCELWSNDQSGFDEALDLVKAVQGAGKPTVVVFVSGKPVAEPWIQDNVDAVVQQFYPGELGGLAIAEVLFGAVNPSGT
ncbi:Glycoside hydrolase family 3 protein [Mycena chlorophos]|uniref:Glycoside hydrolase family 3 protein n=1 Tax=Mycena chlorophos TaxID=658473 RepID=A0A8H6SBI2_MYCCL|nr:Glycoside hydrolase family 3 protein [Mycena chlorophos]